jgi:hypothetical protein
LVIAENQCISANHPNHRLRQTLLMKAFSDKICLANASSAKDSNKLGFFFMKQGQPHFCFFCASNHFEYLPNEIKLPQLR